MFKNYLITHHKDDLYKILHDVNVNKYFSIEISFTALFANDTELANDLLENAEESINNWNKATIQAQIDLINQNKDFVLKNNVNCRIFGLLFDLNCLQFPDKSDIGRYLQLNGTIVRTTVTKMFEFQREYICTKCKHQIIVKAEYEHNNIINKPKKCTNPDLCKSTTFINVNELNTINCKDYQEVKIQELINNLDIGCIPNSIWVQLEDDLVDSCKPGDNVIICGIVKRRWKSLYNNRKMEIELIFKAHHVFVNNLNIPNDYQQPEMQEQFEKYWQQSTNKLLSRNLLLKSICPQIFGLYYVKLAICIVLAGGCCINNDDNTIKVRSESHLLLVGDPGTGKSHLLRFVSKIVPRSVLTTGIGTTAAGLTVTAIQENGEWQLEAGALVLSDGGICCIDEFNSMKEHDRTSIHEAMEQQTISVAKAGIVCKLSTKCTILAACNPKGNQLNDDLSLNTNLAIASPLLSRFDLILLLKDNINDEWDNLICDYVLNNDFDDNLSKFVKNTNEFKWNMKTLQAYFTIIKKLNPLLTDESKRILSSYYQLQRQINGRNKSRTTVRLLDSLIRLSQGHARLMFHDKVEILDAIYAITLVDIAMNEDGRILNCNLNNFPTNPDDEYEELMVKVLTKLNLMEFIKKTSTTLENVEIQSKFFKRTRSDDDVDVDRKKTKESNDDSLDFNDDSFISSTQVEKNQPQTNETNRKQWFKQFSFKPREEKGDKSIFNASNDINLLDLDI